LLSRGRSCQSGSGSGPTSVVQFEDWYYTGGEAALRGFNVVVPVDGMASVEAFAEQYVAWHMTHAPIISPKVTLTRTDMIKF
jgi:hypothetical protein